MEIILSAHVSLWWLHLHAGRPQSSWWTQLPHVYLPFELSQGAQGNGQVGIEHGAFIVDVSEDGPPKPCLLAFQVQFLCTRISGMMEITHGPHPHLPKLCWPVDPFTHQFSSMLFILHSLVLTVHLLHDNDGIVTTQSSPHVGTGRIYKLACRAHAKCPMEHHKSKFTCASWCWIFGLLQYNLQEHSQL